MLVLLVCHMNADPMWISPVFEKITLAIFGQGYQGWKFLVFLVIVGQGYQWWMFLFFESFWSRLPMVKFFVFSWLFLAKDTNGESFCFFDHFWPRIPTVEDLVGLGHFWPRIPMVKVLVGLSHFWLRLPTVKVFVFHGYFCPSLLLLATLAVNTNDVSYVCDLRFVFEQPLGSRSAKLEAISGTPLCKQEFVLWEATVGMGLEVWVYSYTGRQALA